MALEIQAVGSWRLIVSPLYIWQQDYVQDGLLQTEPCLLYSDANGQSFLNAVKYIGLLLFFFFTMLVYFAVITIYILLFFFLAHTVKKFPHSKCYLKVLKYCHQILLNVSKPINAEWHISNNVFITLGLHLRMY